MTDKSSALVISASELYASLGFHCQALLANIAQHAAGAPIADLKAIEAEIARMMELARALKTMQVSANSEAA